LWFFRKSIKQLSVTKEEYKRFEISINGLYDTLKHPRKTFNIQGAKSITLNTGYVDESYNEVIEQMMQSEYVWMEQDTVVTPPKHSLNAENTIIHTRHKNGYVRR
jgi:hypothetical protein